MYQSQRCESVHLPRPFCAKWKSGKAASAIRLHTDRDTLSHDVNTRENRSSLVRSQSSISRAIIYCRHLRVYPFIHVGRTLFVVFAVSGYLK